jgi:antitoxin HicB
MGRISDNQHRKKQQRDLDYFMSLSYPFSVEEIDEDGVKNYVLSIPDLPGCWAEGTTLEDARQKLEEAKEVWILANLEEGNPIPEPETEGEYSGKFLLRIPPGLHMKLSKNARHEKLSLNQYIRAILEASFGTNTAFSKEIDLLLNITKSIEKKFQVFEKRMESLEYSYNCLADGLSALYHRTEINIGLAQTDDPDFSMGYREITRHFHKTSIKGRRGSLSIREAEA